MSLDAQTGNTFDALLTAHEEQLVERWSERVVRTTRGWLTEAEVRRQVAEMYSALRAAAEAGRGWLSDPFAFRDASTILNKRSEASFFLPCFS